MATISSHVLNAVDGSHAAGVRVQCLKLDENGPAQIVFDIRSEADGRIAAQVELAPDDVGRVYELVFHLGEYFESAGLAEPQRIMSQAVFRLQMPGGEGRYHVPVIASPHGYSVWWSN